MTARQLAIFVDCPYGGCEDGYCACLEVDLDDDRELVAVEADPDDAWTPRPIETVPISIDDYPPEGTPCPP
ncbi:hypothetical protein [Streptomyces sp. G1]|uniref:hypothetical protein n=1 Tax=Streptomyces sp. G1 TaxID=361572 RepID=UPI00202E117A|nr:hypothetical protein [Streptomyces sp. G1]MCM1977169.1 hypothetical protein [Streptomyces sp. G1]